MRLIPPQPSVLYTLLFLYTYIFYLRNTHTFYAINPLFGTFGELLGSFLTHIL